MSSLEGRLILLGVTGSIAAYKSAEIARALTAAGADVQPLMTHTAQAFLGPLTLQTLTRRRPMTDPLELLPDQRIAHIVAADTADLILVAPATARWMAAMAAGLADDVVTATCLATSAPVVVAPAMDGEMYAHPATRSNLDKLRSFGYAIVEPEYGPLASGQVGQGRLAEFESILAAVDRALEGRPIRQPDTDLWPPRDSADQQDLAGWHVVITAGGTAEPIDPVRFIGNRSTGKMGAAIADAALARGAHVTLIHGQTSVPLPDGAALVSAPTAAEMRTAVLEAIPEADVLVMAAAVADFRPRAQSDTKIARADGLTLELEPTSDILAEAVAAARANPRTRDALMVGFAAETGSLARAREKAERKGVDLLVANDVSEEGSGFGTDTNRVTIVVPGEPDEAWPQMSKPQVAERLLDRLIELKSRRGAELAAR
ncbi:MAG TPA: bifunctional phosphopantothenoylcysteine decarboxylase/phosphopantothenate--cysteine ligase CoaBC [Candidatus Limnocylindrales bacterium]|nr:bifunctional phosphopantothenoylcysteine decarboxylase/phosphopantothenate--cysteine ligase CoaBC [Candidatus Limnocylindrales bacterium]